MQHPESRKTMWFQDLFARYRDMGAMNSLQNQTIEDYLYLRYREMVANSAPIHDYLTAPSNTEPSPSHNRVFKLPTPRDWPPFLHNMNADRDKLLACEKEAENPPLPVVSNPLFLRNNSPSKDHYRFTSHMMRALFPNIKDTTVCPESELSLRPKLKGPQVQSQTNFGPPKSSQPPEELMKVLYKTVEAMPRNQSTSHELAKGWGPPKTSSYPEIRAWFWRLLQPAGGLRLDEYMCQPESEIQQNLKDAKVPSEESASHSGSSQPTDLGDMRETVNYEPEPEETGEEYDQSTILEDDMTERLANIQGLERILESLTLSANAALNGTGRHSDKRCSRTAAGTPGSIQRPRLMEMSLPAKNKPSRKLLEPPNKLAGSGCNWTDRVTSKESEPAVEAEVEEAQARDNENPTDCKEMDALSLVAGYSGECCKEQQETNLGSGYDVIPSFTGAISGIAGHGFKETVCKHGGIEAETRRVRFEDTSHKRREEDTIVLGFVRSDLGYVKPPTDCEPEEKLQNPVTQHLRNEGLRREAPRLKYKIQQNTQEERERVSVPSLGRSWCIVGGYTMRHKGSLYGPQTSEVFRHEKQSGTNRMQVKA